MKKLTVLFIFFITFFNAQQLESLRILKARHDSIKNVIVNDFNKNSVGKTTEEYNKIYSDYKDKMLKNSIERKKNYRLAVEEFLKTQKKESENVESSIAESSQNQAVSSNSKETHAQYSLGNKLYQEVQNYLLSNIDNYGLNDYPSKSSKIYFWVKRDNTLFIEKVEGADSRFNDFALLSFLMTTGKWTAGKINEKPVPVRFILPVKFMLEE